METSHLAPVINIDLDKCVNCYACISICPVKYCMDGSGEKLTINHDMCVGCGNCVYVCTHDARSIQDDTASFLADISKGGKYIAIVAPAVASVFPNRYKNINGWLKSIGVEAVFDVSFGAELTVKSYLEYIKKNLPKITIAQPCPAIVTFCEIYHPELLPYLAPADSPMLHTIKMIRRFYPEWRNHKVAVLSPCAAKRREFDETGLGDYNVTFVMLKKYFDDNGISLPAYPATDYDNPPAERAVTFSMPGGLLATAEREVPGIGGRTRKIEGVHGIYPYLQECSKRLSKGEKTSFLVDCLNCEKGCNGGPGTGNAHKDWDEIELPVLARRAEMEKAWKAKPVGKPTAGKLKRAIKNYWQNGLYTRTYQDRSAFNKIRHPSDSDLTPIYHSMRKFEKKHFFDCGSCGYGSCRGMAIAIYNRLNKPENCHHYNMILFQERNAHIDDLNEQMRAQVSKSLSAAEDIKNKVTEVNDKVLRQVETVERSSEGIMRMIEALNATSESATTKLTNLERLVERITSGQKSMGETIAAVAQISEAVDGVSGAIKTISEIASSTNLLAMNAAIEAAHAGQAGAGFAVVADEIRRLAESTRENSGAISKILSGIISGIEVTSHRSGEANVVIDEMSGEIKDFAAAMADLINTFAELSHETNEITKALNELHDVSSEVKISHDDMMKMASTIHETMANIGGQ